MAKKKTNKKKKRISFSKVLALIVVVGLIGGYVYGLRYERQIDEALSLIEVESYDSGDVVDFDGKMTVHFLDVGNADATLVELPDNKLMLIDGGDDDSKTKNKFDSYISNLSEARLERNLGEITRFDYGVITHAHEDHIGSMDYVLERYQPFDVFYRPNTEATNGSFYDPALGLSGSFGFWGGNWGEQSSGVYQRVISAIYAYSNEVRVTNPADPYQWTIKPDLPSSHDLYYEVNFYGSSSPYYAKTNNYSPIIILEYQGRRIALSGDAESMAENEFVLLADAGVGRYEVFTSSYNIDVLKLGHHGSDTSNSENFLARLVPLESYRQNVIVFVPTDGKKHGHPSQTVLGRLVDMKFEMSNVYRADLDGDLAVDLLFFEGSDKAVCAIGGVFFSPTVYKYNIFGIEVRYKTVGLAVVVVFVLILVPLTFLSTKNKDKIIKAAKNSAKNGKK